MCGSMFFGLLDGIAVTPNATTMNPLVAVSAARLSDKHEAFVQALMSNGGHLVDAYRAVYPNAGSTEAAYANACRLRARQDVKARIDELTRRAAQASVIDAATLLRELHELATADPGEISRVVTEPCSACWTDDLMAAALDASAAPGAILADFEAPRTECPQCRGRGVQRVVITPTHELRGAARRLYQGARQKADGSIEVRTVDQLAARRELHELLGLHVSRVESKNLNVNVTAEPKDVSAEELLNLWKATHGN
jgi:phage terminase small subunit